MRNILLFAIPLLAGAALHAENWPQFRGPTSQGHSAETGLPLNWSATENLAWKTSVPGEGWSSPIVFGNRVFVTAASHDGVKCHIICLDRKSGQVVWDKLVFVLGDNGEMTVLAVGPKFKVLAKNSLRENVQASIAISQGHLFIRSENKLFCIGAK